MYKIEQQAQHTIIQQKKAQRKIVFCGQLPL